MGCFQSSDSEQQNADWEAERARKQQELQETVDTLTKTPFFLQLSDEELEEFAGHFRLEKYGPGVQIVRQGDAADSFFVLGSGSAEIYITEASHAVLTRGNDAAISSTSTSAAAAASQVEVTSEELDTPSKPAADKRPSAIRATSLFGSPDEIAVDTMAHRRQTVIVDKHTNDKLVYVNALRPGAFFGVNALQPGPAKVRAATIMTAEMSIVLKLQRSEFDEFLAKHPQRRKGLLDTIGQKMEDHLKAVPFLSIVQPHKLDFLTGMFRYKPLRKGDVLFNEGDIGLEMYIVLNGAVSPRASNAAANAPVITIGAGKYFGEIALLVDIPRTATISALEDSLLLELRKSDYQRMIKLAPELKPGFDQIGKERVAEHFRRYQIPFFTAIPLDRYHDLAALCKLGQYKKNEVIFKEGDPGDAFYVVMYGQVSIQATKNEKTIEIAKMNPGQYFGEVALVRDTPRTATVVCTERSVIMCIEKQAFQSFFVEFPEALADFHVKLARYDISLHALIHHEVGRRFFTEYLESEFSAENITFWLAVKEYAAVPDADAERRAALGREIFAHYLAKDATEPINVNSSNLKAVEKAVDEGRFDAALFQACATEIFALMATDTFKRFKQSPKFQEFLKESHSYEKTEQTAAAVTVSMSSKRDRLGSVVTQ